MLNRLSEYPRLVLAAVLLLAAVSLMALPGLELDMSFRPLFKADGVVAATTDGFRKEFGEPSGAYIGVILTAASADRAALKQNAQRVAASVKQLEDIPEVITPAERDRFVSDDGRHALVLAKVGLPLKDLEGRATLIRKFRSTVESSHLPAHTSYLFVGLSVVEAEYARLVGWSVAKSLVLTTLVLVLVLALLFRRPAAIAIALAGVSVTLPVTIALLVLLDQRVTIINSMVPTMILIIGVADAIHMMHCWIARRHAGDPPEMARREMLREMLRPCFLTAATTALGFISLRSAGMQAIRDFGSNVAIGVALVFCFNMLLVPALIRLMPERWLLPRAGTGVTLSRWSESLALWVIGRQRAVIAAFAVASVACIGALPRLIVDQRFNEEVPASHDLRRAQTLLEDEFGGYLGPELLIERLDQTSMMSAEAAANVQRVAQRIRRMPEVHTVDPMRNAQGTRIALLIRIGDVGSSRSVAFAREVRALAKAELGPEYLTAIVGEWWLAQLGLSGLLRDMLMSFATSALFVLPILALGLRNRRLFLVAIVPNLLPTFFALGFMAVSGITVRIGTAMILAIALAIAVDDTIHFLSRLRAEPLRDTDPQRALVSAMRATGPAMIYTTVVLVLGFLSMASSDLLALRDMGILAAATLAMALVADLLLAPALYLQLFGVARVRNAAAAATSSDRGLRARHSSSLEVATHQGA